MNRTRLLAGASAASAIVLVGSLALSRTRPAPVAVASLPAARGSTAVAPNGSLSVPEPQRAEAEPDAARHASLEGRVLTAGGRPIGGATVRALHAPEAGDCGCGHDAGSLAGEVRTTPTGEFHLDGLEPGARYVLRASAEHHAVALDGPHVARTLGSDPVVLRLDARARLRGVVRTDEGAPVPGARVLAEAVRAGAPRTGASARTNEAGELDLSVAADFVLLTVEARGWTPWVSTVDLRSLDAPLEVVLRPGGAIEGIVEVDGAPVPGVELRLAGRRSTARTDEHGRFRFRTVPAGLREIEVVPAEGAAAWAPIEVRVRDRATSEVRLALPVGPRGRVAGRVLVDGAAPESCWVRLVARGDDAARMAPAERARAVDGHFTLEDIPAGEWVLETMALHPGGGSITMRQEVTVHPGRQTAVWPRVETGLVRFDAAPPGDGGEIELQSLRGGSWRRIGAVVDTDEQGLRVPVPGTYRLAIDGSSGAPVELTAWNRSAELALATSAETSEAP